MKLLSSCMCLGFAAGTVLGHGQEEHKISMVFNNTDASVVLSAISKKTHANIIYSGTVKVPVTVHVTVDTPEQAVQSVVSAAGLAYRKVGSTFVVASPKDMRQTLAAYAFEVKFTPGIADVTQLTSKLQDLYPDASFTALGSRIGMTGLNEDIQSARVFIDDYRTRNPDRRQLADVVTLMYAAPSDVSNVLTSLYPSLKVTAVATSSGHGGAVGLAGPEDDVRAAESEISKLDKANLGVPESTVKVYSLQYVSAPEVVKFLTASLPNVKAVLGPEVYQVPKPQFNPLSASLAGGSDFFGGSSSGSGTTGGQSTGGQSNGGGIGTQGTVPVKPGDRARTVILAGSESDVAQAIKLIEAVDVKPKQIMVECRVMETDPTFAEQLGLDWNLTNTQTITEGAPGASGIGFGTFTRTTPLSFSATLNASIVRGDAKLLADPKIQASDNTDASIFVGQTINVAISTSGALGQQNVTTQSYPVGIILLIRPRVGADGSITMHVDPVVSTITSINADGLPQIQQREAETIAVLKDGQTMVIGGLIQDNMSNAVNEIPLLSKIPLLGELFRYRNTSHNRTDVIVTLTPHIIKEDAKS